MKPVWSRKRVRQVGDAGVHGIVKTVMAILCRLRLVYGSTSECAYI